MLNFPAVGAIREVPVYEPPEQLPAEQDAEFEVRQAEYRLRSGIRAGIRLRPPSEVRPIVMANLRAIRAEEKRRKDLPEEADERATGTDAFFEEQIRVDRQAVGLLCEYVTGFTVGGSPVDGLRGDELLQMLEHTRMLHDVANACRGNQTVGPEEKKS